MISKILTSIAAVAIVLTISLNASADPKVTTQDEKGYGYEFEDDPLAAGGFGPNDSTIRVRAKPQRTTLIRPRTTFVPEMLRSVEDI